MCADVSGVSEVVVVDPTIALDEIFSEVPVKEEISISPIAKKACEELFPEEQLKILLTEGGTKHETLKVLKTLFGASLLDKVARSGMCNQWPERLTRENVLVLLGEIGHSITLDDLEQVFAELKAGDTSREILKYAQVPYLRMWWAGSAQQLPSYWLNHLLELFRNPLQMIDPSYEKHLGVDLLEAKIYKTRSLSYTYYDYAIKELIKQGDRSRPEFFMSHKELIAKFIAYANPNTTQNGMIVPVFNENTGQLDYYQLSDQVHHSGLHCYFLTPLESNKSLPAQLIFRGTDCPASAHRDLDPTGVGKRTFDECAPQIQAILSRYAQKTEHPKVEIINHSLGAADGQRALINMIDPSNDFFYDEIKLFAYCSPKLDTVTIDKWYENLQALQSQEKKPQLYFTFAHHEKDIVTWTGDANISGTDDFYIPSNYLVVKSDSGIIDFAQHHTSPFFKFGNFNFTVDNRTFQFYQSFEENELTQCINKLAELENTYGWYLTLKSYFVHVDTVEELQKQIEELQMQQERLKELHTECPYKSWLLWSATRALNYTLQPLVYYAFGWLTGAQKEAAAG